MKIFYLIATTLIIFGGHTSCSNKKEKNNKNTTKPPVNVSIYEAEKKIVSIKHTYPANVVPINETELRAEVSGFITGIYINDGQQVSKGQKLYEIDRTRYQAAVDQAKANLSIAESNYDRVQKDLDRYQKLAEKDAIARQTLDYAQADLTNQKAQVESAKAELTNANMNLQRATIYAPFAGTVGISAVRMGALVSIGSTLLNTISSTNPIQVEFQINEREIEQVENLIRNKTNSGIGIILPNGQTYSEVGYISMIDRAVNRETGTLRVRSAFKNDAGRLRAGMNLTLTLKESTPDQSIVIPQSSVQEQLGVSNVYVITDSNMVRFQKIELGSRFEDMVVVNRGLKEGDKVVVDGGHNLSDKDKVTVEPKKTQAKQTQ